jgi:hypothetical protein
MTVGDTPKKPTQSRAKATPKSQRIARLEKPKKISKTGVELTELYCRKCMQLKKPEKFYESFDRYLDSNGMMSVCKDCIGDIYIRIFQTEHTMERALLRLCRMLNVRYSLDAVAATQKHFRNANKTPDEPTAFGVYKVKLIATQKTEVGKREAEDYTFVEPGVGIAITNPLDDSETNRDLKKYWGIGVGNYDDYVFLEEKLSEWKQSYSCANKSEEFFLKEICYKELELQRARIEQKPVDGILKSMNDLLKNAALTPAQTSAINSGKVHDAWGTLIRQIEETTPAEFYKDKKLFRDFDGIGTYIKNYIVRSLKNFVLGSKDFNIVEEDTSEDDIMEWSDDGNESEAVSK